MALRSLAGKLGARLLRWAKASEEALPPPAAASDLDMALKKVKLEGSLEEQAQAIWKSSAERTRHLVEDSNRRIRKNYRDAWIIGVVGFGFSTYVWSRAAEKAAECFKLLLEAKEGKVMDEEQE